MFICQRMLIERRDDRLNRGVGREDVHESSRPGRLPRERAAAPALAVLARSGHPTNSCSRRTHATVDVVRRHMVSADSVVADASIDRHGPNGPRGRSREGVLRTVAVFKLVKAILLIAVRRSGRRSRSRSPISPTRLATLSWVARRRSRNGRQLARSCDFGLEVRSCACA